MSTFEAKRISRSFTIKLNAEPDVIFPLFTPEGEKKWAAGWDYALIHPRNGNIEEDLIFKTTDHDHKQRDAVWIITKYDPHNFQIEYLRVEPEVKVGKIQVECTADEAGKTSATVTYTYTGLSGFGNTFINAFTENQYQDFISGWEKAINYYLETGEILTED